MGRNTFTVIDTNTGEYPDLEAIALHEDWAKGLVYCDMEGFAIEEDGSLLLLDECDNSRYCPIGRFEVVWEEQEPVKPICQILFDVPYYFCGSCKTMLNMYAVKAKYCSQCGRQVKWK